MAAAQTEAQRYAALFRHAEATGFWHLYASLGAGTFGVVGAFARHDPNYYVVDRCAIKDTHVASAADWPRMLSWTGRPVQQGGAPLIAEIGAMRALRPAGSQYIVTLRAATVQTARLTYRIYTELCGRGDLGDVFDHYVAMNEPVPEPAVWAILWALTEAFLVLDQGHPTTPVENWQPIVHRDIKPGNIMLGNYPLSSGDRTSPFRLYPTPKLGDFGMAFQVRPQNPTHATYRTGTRGYQAAEQGPGCPYALTSKANVFGLGVTVMTLMCRATGRAPRHWHDWSNITTLPTTPAWTHYSPELRAVVQKCVSKMPRHRLTLQALKAKVESYCCGPEDRTQGLAYVFEGQLPRFRGGALDLAGVPAEFYPIGARFAP